MYECLIFDLDGTISDPKVGIVNCINYSLQHFGIESRHEQDITPYIGPPLDTAFIELTGIQDLEIITSLVEKYRERYARVGYAENILYPGVSETLAQLCASKQFKLALCTSKRVDFANSILRMFGLFEFFELVSGGDIGIEKWQQLEGLIQRGEIPSNSLMIGDRAVDLIAAHKNGMDSAAVLWGYGSDKELSKENPKYLFRQPAELMQHFL